MLSNLFQWLHYFNDNYATAIQALSPFVIAFASWFYYKTYKESKLSEGDAALDVDNKFTNYFGNKYKILAVHKFEKSEDISGYKHISQNSRTDQWEKLININSDSYCFFTKYKITPKNKHDVLTVIISRNGKEKWHTINLNK